MPSPHDVAGAQMTGAANAGRDAPGEAARTVTDGAARAGEQAARADTDVARRGIESVRDHLRASLNAVIRSFQRMMDQCTQGLSFNRPQAERLARRSAGNLQAVTRASLALVRGAEEVSQEVSGLIRNRLQKNVEAVNRLASMRSVQDFVAVQSDLARDMVQQVIETNRRMAEVSLRIAEEASRIIQVQANQNADQARRAA